MSIVCRGQATPCPLLEGRTRGIERLTCFKHATSTAGLVDAASIRLSADSSSGGGVSAGVGQFLRSGPLPRSYLPVPAARSEERGAMRIENEFVQLDPNQ